MSTRCVFKFYRAPLPGEEDDVCAAMVYMHCDGYPDGEHGAIAMLQAFFEQLDNKPRQHYINTSWLSRLLIANFKGRNLRPIDAVPGDAEYVYEVMCYDLKHEHPQVTCVDIRNDITRRFSFKGIPTGPQRIGPALAAGFEGQCTRMDEADLLALSSMAQLGGMDGEGGALTQEDIVKAVEQLKKNDHFVAQEEPDPEF